MRPAPIPTEVLKDILARRKDDPEVLALLWEIHRYQVIARKACQLAHATPTFDLARSNIVNGMLDLLENDPAVLEMRALQAEILADYKGRTPERKKRD
jgi:hypothetical protein